MEPDHETNELRKKDLDWWIDSSSLHPFLPMEYNLAINRRVGRGSTVTEVKLPDSLILILVPIAKALNRVFVVNP